VILKGHTKYAERYDISLKKEEGEAISDDQHRFVNNKWKVYKGYVDLMITSGSPPSDQLHKM